MTVSRTFLGRYHSHLAKGEHGEILVTVALGHDEGLLFVDGLGPAPSRAKNIPVAIVGGRPAEALGIIAAETRDGAFRRMQPRRARGGRP